MSDLTTTDNVAKELGVSTGTVQRWARQGKIPSVKLPGGRRRFDTEKIKYAMGFGNPQSNDGQPNPFTHPQLNPPVQPSLAPPADGQVTVPSIQGLVALLQAGRKYYFQSDQAVRDSQTNAQIMERNLSIMEPLQSRLLSACQMPVTVVPDDQRDKAKMKYASELQKIIENIPNFFKYKWALMQAIWYGRAGVQNIYSWDFSEGYKRLIVKDWVPVHGDNLVYKFDSPAVGLRVGVASGNQGGGTKELYVEPADFSRVHPLSEHEREAHVIHTHLLLAGTFLDPYAGGNVKGTGIRNVIYWTWYLQNQCLAMLVEYLERAGLGMTIVTYQAGNPEDQNIAQQIAQAQSFNNVITWPRWPGQSKDGQNEIYRIEPTLAGVQNFMTLINDYWNGEMRRYIVGQDSTSKPVSTGLGSEIAAVQESTFFRLVKMDCLNLEETLTRELLHVIMKYTFPELPLHQFKVKINTNKPDSKEYMEGVKSFIEIGGSVIESEVRQTLGLTEPTAEDKVLGGKSQDEKVLGAPLAPGDTETQTTEEVELEEQLVNQEG
jgi:excisionase family DNA binding protein